MAWNEGCREKKECGLGLVDPDLAKVSLTCKWIHYAMEPCDFNFQILLRFKLTECNQQ